MTPDLDAVRAALAKIDALNHEFEQSGFIVEHPFETAAAEAIIIESAPAMLDEIGRLTRNVAALADAATGAAAQRDAMHRRAQAAEGLYDREHARCNVLVDELRARVADLEGERNDARRDAAIWQGVAEGERERCVDAIGVHGTYHNDADWMDAIDSIRALPAPEVKP